MELEGNFCYETQTAFIRTIILFKLIFVYLHLEYCMSLDFKFTYALLLRKINYSKTEYAVPNA
jgi:hypothetical protein